MGSNMGPSFIVRDRNINILGEGPWVVRCKRLILPPLVKNNVINVVTHFQRLTTFAPFVFIFYLQYGNDVLNIKLSLQGFLVTVYSILNLKNTFNHYCVIVFCSNLRI